MGKEVGITAIVIARNEERKLPECLESLNWVDELIVIDDASTDRTPKIAKVKKARVFAAPSADQGNYSKLRNFGAKKSSGKWILYVDADERVPQKLKEEIISIVGKMPQRNYAYAIPRRNIILGREMLHGGWWPDYVKRLFWKSGFRGWSGELHEEPEFEGEIGHLSEYLVHMKHDNLSEMVEKTNIWSEVEAKLMLEAKHPKMNLPRFSSAMFREFFLRVVRQKAYLDGTEGMIYALYQVFSRFLSYGKLWEMQLKLNK